MFGSLSFNEILFIMVLALLIFGPKRLPQMGRSIGRALGEFRRASSDLKRSMEIEMTAAEEKGTAGQTPMPTAPPVEAVPVTPAVPAPSDPIEGESSPEGKGAAEAGLDDPEESDDQAHVEPSEEPRD